MLFAPSVTSKLSRLLLGLMVRVVTWVELRGCSAPDVPLTSAWVSSWVHQGVVATGKNIYLPKSSLHLSPHLPPSPFPLRQSPSLCTSSLPQACAPLYSWRTEKDIPRSDATGTCYLSAHNFTKFVEYAPCRTGNCHLSFKSYTDVNIDRFISHKYCLSWYDSCPLCRR